MKKNAKRMLSLIMTMVMLLTSVGVFTPTASAEEKHEFNGHTYQIIKSLEIDWNSAKLQCEQMGGHLATITSAAENQFLLNLLKKEGVELVWLGASDSSQEHNWQWVTGEPFNYADWAPNEPNNGLGSRCHSTKGCTYDKNGCTNYLNHRGAFGGDVLDGEEDYLGYYTDVHETLEFDDVRWNDYYPSGRHSDFDMQGFICEWESAEQLPSGYDFLEDSYNFPNYSTIKISKKYFTTIYEPAAGELLYNKKKYVAIGGICFGMAYTTSAIYNGLPNCNGIYSVGPWTEHVDFCENIRDIKKDSRVVVAANNQNISIKDYIKYAFIYQYSANVRDSMDATWGDAKGLYNLVKEYANNGSIGVAITLWHYHLNKSPIEWKCDCGHTVLAVGVDGNDILIDDPNFTNGLRRLTVNNDGTWEYDYNWNDGHKIKCTNEQTEEITFICYNTDYHMPYALLSTGRTIEVDEDCLDDSGVVTTESYVIGADRLCSDKMLISIEADSFDLSTENTVDISNTIGINAELTQANDGNLFWVDKSEKTFTVSNLTGENNEVILAGKHTLIGAKSNDSSDITLTLDEDTDVSTDINTTKGNAYTVFIETIDDNDENQSTTITGTASGDTVTATQTENGVTVEGFDSMTITYETADGTDTEEIKGANGEKINITTDDDKNEVSTDYECKHEDENHDGICDNCDYDFTASCNHYCHSESKFIQFLFKIFNLLNRIFGLEQYCSCGKAHW